MRSSNRKIKTVVFAFALLGFVNVGLAQVVKNVGVIQPIPSLTTFQTWGGPNDEGAVLPAFYDYTNNMEGIRVTVEFSGAAPETKSWTGMGFADPGGGVNGDDGDWSLVNPTVPASHTYSSPWVLSYAGGPKGNLTAFEIDGFGKLLDAGVIAGNTAFDTTNPNTGTVGSLEGRDFNVVANTHATLATYSDAITLGGPPVLDLYRRLRVDFKGQVDTKWLQAPRQELGENLHSDLDWRLLSNGDRQSAADDFISDGRPISGVRWWGSYFNRDEQPQPDPVNNNLVPPIEDGFVISLFQSEPGATEPGRLLGSYVAPVEVVDISPTLLVGWDQHPVWEYAVDFDQTLLEHASEFAQPDAFLEENDVEYWIGIAALNGVVIDTDSGTIKENDDEIRTTPWWGWHTSPDVVDDPPFVDDDILVATVRMDAAEWLYEPWNRPDLAHGDDSNLSFELLTTNGGIVGLDGSPGNDSMSFVADTDTVVVPEPGSPLLLLVGAVSTLIRTRRRR